MAIASEEDGRKAKWARCNLDAMARNRPTIDRRTAGIDRSRGKRKRLALVQLDRSLWSATEKNSGSTIMSLLGCAFAVWKRPECFGHVLPDGAQIYR